MNNETAAIQLMLTPGLGARTLARLIDAAKVARVPLSYLVEAPVIELVSRFDLKEAIAQTLGQSRDEARRFADSIAEKGLRTLLKYQRGYPDRLLESMGKDAPPLLFAAGNVDLLSRESIAICGSRTASAEGLQCASTIAGQIARAGYNIVSGYAAGVDSAAHAGALLAGRSTTFVLAEGLLHFRPKDGLGELLQEDNFAVVSEFLPDTRWAAHNAMQRNRTIIGLSSAVVIVESGLEGGTFDAGTAALKQGAALFAVQFETPPESAAGNAHFISKGARPLKILSNGKVDVGPVLAALQEKRHSGEIPGDGMLFPVHHPSLRKPA